MYTYCITHTHSHTHGRRKAGGLYDISDINVHTLTHTHTLKHRHIQLFRLSDETYIHTHTQILSLHQEPVLGYDYRSASGGVRPLLDGHQPHQEYLTQSAPGPEYGTAEGPGGPGPGSEPYDQ